MRMDNLNFKVWQPSCGEKILKDKTYALPQIKELSVKLYANETESVRLCITPRGDIRSLCVELTDVDSAISLSPGFVLYVKVEKSSAGTKSEVGAYPDALLPFSVAQSHGLNTINAGENQEIYITVRTAKNAVAGEYFSRVTIFADDEKKVLPLKITVWDYCLPEKNHTRQYFIIDDKQLSLIEDNKGYKAYKHYYEQLLQYRVNGSRMPFSTSENYRQVTASYIAGLRTYYCDDRISVFSLPIFYTEKSDDVEYTHTQYLFDEIIKASVADGVDYFKKAITYLWILDEPHLSKMRTEYCKKVLPRFEELKNKTVASCLSKEADCAIYAQIAQSIKNMPNVITSAVNGKIITERDEDYRITWCPPFDNLAQQEYFKMWSALNKGEKWWYGCNWPVPPYPTYHIDDTYASPRILSWIQYAYQITGNLYWRINYWARRENDKLTYIDPYEHITYPTTNGEGMLVYPGVKFGMEGFVPSIRLEAIRNGIEDYEALYCLDGLFSENAKKINKDCIPANSILQPLYTRVFDKTMILQNAEAYLEEAREIVANLISAAKRYAFTVLSFDKEKAKIVFYATAFEVNVLGGKLKNSGNVYTVTAEREELYLTLQNERGEQVTVKLFMSEKRGLDKYALSDCWAETVKKYNIDSCDAENILKPYYSILEDETVENYHPCCICLTELIGFVWKTETAILKKQRGDAYEISFIVPNGKFETMEKYTAEKIDESASRYTIVTKQPKVCVSVETEKGKYTARLYIY